MRKQDGPTRREVLLSATASIAAGSTTSYSLDEPAAKEGPTLRPEHASRFAKLALANIQREYPNKPGDVLNGLQDVKSPRTVHPAFYGSFDWHSSVHAHWMLVRLLRLFPELPPGERRSARCSARI